MKMKKIISFLLVAIMALSSVSYAQDAESQGRYEEEMKVIKSFNIFSYFHTAKEEDSMSRAEFLSTVLEFMYGSIPDSDGTIQFSDVSPDSPYRGAVSYAESMGIIDGNPGGEFNPDTAITTAQAVKILITAMGYKDIATTLGGYPSGYFSIAYDLDVLKGVVSRNDEHITAGVCAKMLINAGFADPLNVKQRANGMLLEMDDDENIFWKVHKISFGEGVLSANEYTALNSTAILGAGYVTIGDFTGKAYNSASLEEYIGYHVRYYFRENDLGDIVLCVLPSKKNDATLIDAENVGTFIDGVLSYCKDAESTRLTRKTIPLNASVIYNGRLITTYDENDFVGKTGTVTIIDNNGDGNVDVVNIVAYENYVIRSIDLKDKVIYDAIDSTHKISYENYENRQAIIIWDNDGNRITVDKLKENDVLSVVKSKDSVYIRGFVSAESISGIVTGKTVDKNDVPYVEIDSQSYKIESRCNTSFSSQIVGGEKITVFLDTFGRVAYIERKISKEGYALVLKEYAERGDEGRMALKLFTSSGATEIFELADKLKVDGAPYRGQNVIPPNVSSSNIIRYKLNDAGLITSIDTPVVTTETGGSMHKMIELKNIRYVSNSKNFGGQLPVISNILIFRGPENTRTADVDEYKISSTNDLANSASYSGVAYVVDTDTMIPDVLFLYDDRDTTLVHTSPTAVVKKVTTSCNEDDELVYEISAITAQNNDLVIRVHQDGYMAVSTGDIIKYSMGSDGYAEKIEPIYYESTQTANHNEAAGRGTPLTGIGGYYDSQNKLYFGKVTNKDGNLIEFEIDDALLNHSENKTAKTTYHNFASTKIIVVDTDEYLKDDRVYVSNINEVYDSKHFAKASRAAFYTSYGTVPLCVIYKNK